MTGVASGKQHRRREIGGAFAMRGIAVNVRNRSS